MTAASLDLAQLRKLQLEQENRTQIPWAILVVVLAIGAGVFFHSYSPKIATFWVFGLAFGYVVQRSRFCFAAASRDPYLTGSTSLLRGVLVAFAVSTIGVSAIKYGAFLADPNAEVITSGVNALNLSLPLGALLFGIGMVIAGGCASGTLMRIGEGNTLQLVVLVFFVIGSAWGAHDSGAFWYKLTPNAPKVFLPDVFGWLGAVVVQLLVIALLWIAALKWQEKKAAAAIAAAERGE